MLYLNHSHIAVMPWFSVVFTDLLICLLILCFHVRVSFKYVYLSRRAKASACFRSVSVLVLYCLYRCQSSLGDTRR